MTFLRNVLINVNSAINQRRWLRSEAERLQPADDRASARVVLALESTVLRNEFSVQERERFEAIEALRRRMLWTFAVLGQSGDGAESEISVFRAVLSSKSAFWARVIFALVREFRPETCLELGTNMGISAAYQASALKLNGAGRLITLEGDGARARCARRNLGKLGLDNVEVVRGRFQDVLPAILKESSGIDFCFIDGHHDEVATREYFELIAANLTRPAVVVLDDISWSHGMRRAWETIQRGSGIRNALDLRVLGICIVE